MEEWVGLHWHRLVSRWADTSYPQQAVALEAHRKSVELLFRAAGGDPAVRIVPAGALLSGGPRGWLQRLAGSGPHARTAQRDGQTLALPPEVAVFNSRALNHDLLLWLAALAALHPGPGPWVANNRAATAAALGRCPGLRPRWERLLEAHLAQRPEPARLPAAAAAAERQVQAALRGEAVAEDGDADATLVAPVWLWLQALPEAPGRPRRVAEPQGGRTAPASTGDTTRRRSQSAAPRQARAPLLLPSRVESVLTFADHVPLDRGQDDEPDEHALAAADSQERLTVQADGRHGASRVRFDLDLPSASADDLPMGDGLALPEWDWKQQRLLPAHCRVQTRVSRPGAAFQPSTALRLSARRVRRRLEVLRAAPQWQRACPDGDALDLDAWVRHRAGFDHPGAPEPRVYARRVRSERSLATLLLADLSLSTDAHVNNHQRVVDVIRDALYVFGEALNATGDAFAMLGFSSVRRAHVRLQHLKGFDEAWARPVLDRIGAIKPGYYTRMGAALRAATLQLQARGERQRLLLLLTDGKPNDLDVYEGRWGLEDTRHAVMAARAAGLTPFCLSIDSEAQGYLPHLFGPGGWAQVRRPEELPTRLAAVHAQLTRHAAG